MREAGMQMMAFFYVYEIYCRVLISALLGLVIGFDRTHKNKPAGVKNNGTKRAFSSAASRLPFLVYPPTLCAASLPAV